MPEHLAQPPRPPEPSRKLREQLARQKTEMAVRKQREHRSLLRGLLYFGVIAIVFSVARAGLHRAFVPHWSLQW